MQPQWRHTSVPNQLPKLLSTAIGSKQTVISLRKAGPNGVVLLLVSLKWWFGLHKNDARWAMAVTDVHECLKSFLTRDEEEGNQAKKIRQ
jgi:hypothetical protein